MQGAGVGPLGPRLVLQEAHDPIDGRKRLQPGSGNIGEVVPQPSGEVLWGRVRPQRILLARPVPQRGGPAIIRRVAALWNRPGQQYALRPDTPPQDLSRRLRHDFADIAGPWLQALSSVDGIVGFLENEARTERANASALHAALLLAKVGRRDEARRQLAHAPESRDTILRSAHNYGVQFE